MAYYLDGIKFDPQSKNEKKEKKEEANCFLKWYVLAET